jgi:PilZ domain-containing protein
VEIVPANRCCSSARRESKTADHPKKRAPSCVEGMAIDRRTEPRYNLSASVELVDAKSGVRIKARIVDLGLGGCQVHSDRPFPVGTDTNVHITKGKESFEGQAHVVSSLAGKSMGLEFTAVEPKQFHVLKKLLAAALESSWLASDRRKGQRILMPITVRVSGYDERGSSFKENTHTISISPVGALILISASVRIGQRLVLSNIRTKALVECIVAHKGKRQDGGLEVGLQFVLPNPTFWGVSFPPSDWSSQHPDSKSRS